MIDASIVYPLCIIGFMLLNIVVPIIALVDILRADFRKKNEKAIWVLVVLLLGIIGAILYFFLSGDLHQDNKGLK